MITKKQKQRLYRIHKNLRNYGNFVFTPKRLVTLRDGVLTKKELEWIKELQVFDYAICHDMFGWGDV